MLYLKFGVLDDSFLHQKGALVAETAVFGFNYFKSFGLLQKLAESSGSILFQIVV